MTLQLKLPDSFTDDTLPRFRVDPVVPDVGALWLYDFAHPADTAPMTGIPVTGTTVTNIVADQCRAVIGGSEALDGKFTLGSGTNVAGKTKLERTSKGGLHMATTQAVDPGDAGVVLKAGDGPRRWLHADVGRVFYLSIWGRFTRVRAPGAPGGFNASLLEVTNYAGAAGNYLAYIYDLGNSIKPGGVSGRGANALALGGFHASTAPNDWQGSPSADNDDFRATNAMVLGTGGVYEFNVEMRIRNPSWITYRSYCEDLTASGRTYAEVDALDHAQYVADVLTEGGRFYGDTFTDPATLTG